MAETTAFDPKTLSAYVAASLTTASRAAWPDDMRGNAARFIIQDLGEFGEAMVAAAHAGYWSPTKAMERLFLERVQVLMGAGVDHKVARRYLETVLKPGNPMHPLRPGTKARPEDAFSVFIEALGKAEGEAMRKLWVDLLASASDWFVHPTVMGPMLSHGARENAAESAPHWGMLLNVLSQGCVFTLFAGAKQGVILDVDLIRSISGAGRYCIETGAGVLGEGLLALHSALAEAATVIPPEAQ